MAAAADLPAAEEAAAGHCPVAAAAAVVVEHSLEVGNRLGPAVAVAAEGLHCPRVA